MSLNWENDKCRKCKLARTPEGHDPCLGELPGVLFACCGHGNGAGYIYFQSGVLINFGFCSIEQVPPEKLAQSRALKQSELFEAYKLRRSNNTSIVKRDSDTLVKARTARWGNKSSEG